MSGEVVALQPVESGSPLTAQQLRTRLAVIQDVMRSVMQNGSDYGVIPGTGDKPTLYKPGAEKLCVTFRLSAASPLIDSIEESGDIRYRVQVPILSSDGSVLAVGVGECSTGEEKYRWRRPVHVNEYNAAPEDRRREKFQRNGDVWQQVRVNPADVANTVLKMAHKRAYVHGVIMATAAGAIFTQDVEDLPEGVEPHESDQPARPPIQPPQRRSEQGRRPAAPSGAGSTVVTTVRDVSEKTGTNQQGKPWTKFTVHGADGQPYGTFDTEIARIARSAKAEHAPVEIVFTQGKYGRDIESIGYAEREVGAEG